MTGVKSAVNTAHALTQPTDYAADGLFAIIAALVGFTGAFCFLAGGKQDAPKEQI